jgi:hypothetical protein
VGGGLLLNIGVRMAVSTLVADSRGQPYRVVLPHGVLVSPGCFGVEAPATAADRRVGCVHETYINRGLYSADSHCDRGSSNVAMAEYN